MTRRHKSHGCGRRMARNGPEEALAEAVERRARMIRQGGSLVAAKFRGMVTANAIAGDGVHYPAHEHDRRWAHMMCVVAPYLSHEARASEDVGLRGGIPVAMCADCRARQGQP